jgi:uncharacterized damage-inducible protein DinB
MRETNIIIAIPGYPPEVGAALWRLEDSRDRTLHLLKDIPPQYVDLDMPGNTIGTILYHLALIEADWLYSEILEEPYPDKLKDWLPVDDRDQAGLLTFVRGQTLKHHLARLRAVRQTLLDRLRGMTTEDFHRPRRFPNYDVSPAWVLHHLTQHEAEHRGELGRVVAYHKAGSEPGSQETGK